MKTVIKRIIWGVCLIISIGFTIQFFHSFSEDSVFRGVVIVVVIAVENLAQYIWSLAVMAWRCRQYLRAVLFTGTYIWYLVVFALFSGMAYFVDELAGKEQVMEQTAFQQQVNRQKWEQFQSTPLHEGRHSDFYYQV